MRAVYEAGQLTPESLNRAEADYKHAIERDPQYALAYAGLGSAIWNRALATYAGRHTQAAHKSSEQLFRKALELDPELGTVRASLAFTSMQYDWDWGRAEREFRAVLAKGPDVAADQDLGFLLIFHGRFAEAEEHLRRAQGLNPMAPAQINNLALLRHLEGRFAESRTEAQRALALYPSMLAPRVMIALLDIEEGRTDRALADLPALEPRFPGAPLMEAMALARAGRREEALRLIRPLEEKRPDESVAMQWFALVYAFLGDEANTVKWLERSADRREFQVLNLAVHPAYAAMQNSPGFRALKKRMGLDR